MNTRQVRSQPQRGAAQKNYGNNEVSIFGKQCLNH